MSTLLIVVLCVVVFLACCKALDALHKVDVAREISTELHPPNIRTVAYSRDPFEVEILEFRKQTENLQAEIDATIGEIGETVHALQNLNNPEFRFNAQLFNKVRQAQENKLRPADHLAPNGGTARHPFRL
jgi:hypothetical protein